MPQMKLGKSIIQRPITAFIVLAVVVLVIPSLAVSLWYLTTKEVDSAARYASHYVHNEALMDVKTAAKFLFPVKSSTLNVARVLRTSLNATKVTLSGFETKVSPYLFFLFKTLSLSQISYIGSDSILFSYYIQGNQILAVYSNTSTTGKTQWGSIRYNCYSQLVDNDTGKLYGEVHKPSSTFSIDSNWFLEVVNSTTVHASVGRGWSGTQDLLFFNTASVDEVGLVSLGFPVKAFTNAISTIDLHRGDLYVATKDGTLLAQTGPFSIMPRTDSDTVLILFNSTSDQAKQTANISCDPSKDPFRSASMKIGGAIYIVYCAPLEIAGVQSASILLFPHKGLVSLVRSRKSLTIILLISMFASVVLAISYFVILILRCGRKEMYLTSALIKQREATQQAERKSMNKSLAFASASHDVRSALGALGGLISLSVAEVPPNAELYTNLESMRRLSSDLLGILNSVLDASKIEAGKMQLAVEEFDLAQAIEESVNLYYLTGKEKGIDVVLDPSDGSILKYSRVKGDRGKLKQILNNLLHNAIKFTAEGHISVRVWVKKPSLETSLDSILASNGVGVWNYLWRFFYKNNVAYKDFSALHEEKRQQNLVQFIIEVDDTGKGIPKEKRKSVFEDFVQVNETALENGGTGLGLGIVQSLVRLMGGEISIEDKELGEKGTCFRFSISLSTCNAVTATAPEGSETELFSEHTPNISHPNFELNFHNQSPRPDGSHVLLFIHGDERRRIVQKFLESVGINVITPNKLEELFLTLENIKRKWCLSHLSSSGKSEFGSHSDYSSSHDITMVTKDVPVSASGMDNALSLQKNTSYRSAPSFILVVIDVSSILYSDEQFYKLCSILDDYKREFHCSRCKVVWLYTPNSDFELRRLDDEKLAQCEHVVIKPFHGSRLYQVLGLLPEFGGSSTIHCYNAKATETIEQSPKSPGPSTQLIHIKSELGTSKSCPSTEDQLSYNSNKLLFDKKVLVADDNPISRRIANKFLDRLGANTELCENGEEALGLVLKALQAINRNVQEASKMLPYDYILMDCEMPIMDGYEATRQIRMAERPYNVHIPIIALTGHEEGNDAKAAGMDFHLMRPLTESNLLRAINSLRGNGDT